MTLDSRTPSRSSTPTPTTLCLRRTELTNDIQRLSLLIQGVNDTLNSLTRFGSYDATDVNVTTLQNLLLSYTTNHQKAVREFSSLPLCDTPGCLHPHTPPSSPIKISQNSQLNNNDSEIQNELIKNSSQKRKENEAGFITPPSVKLTKRLATLVSKIFK
ncbi:hypothetical protein TNCV_3764711 [Trichonephila clavipes]|uniref:Uncharacterized protein n=1 Tax=Trichonephila clavipes TaxID=2585209 RepID=A0A8X6VVI2_TRICX|nr:hypothetical protein TNCV_3764711 [Trichonephila clavipes]